MKSYIFDLDGTLFDSMEVWENLDIDFLKNHGITDFDGYTESVSVMSCIEAAVYTINRFNLRQSPEDIIREWKDMALYAYGNTVELKPYAKEYLLSLHKKGIKLAVATSQAEELYTVALKRHGIMDLFQVICSTEKDSQGKTKPDVFLKVAKELNTDPKDCIVFEDILAAVKSAKSVGMTVYGVYDKASAKDREEIKKTADGFIYDFREIKDLSI